MSLVRNRVGGLSKKKKESSCNPVKSYGIKKHSVGFRTPSPEEYDDDSTARTCSSSSLNSSPSGEFTKDEVFTKNAVFGSIPAVAPIYEDKSFRGGLPTPIDDDDDSADKYGYGDAAPDSSDKYGYGDAAPDSSDKYGYGDASPDSAFKYGYSDTTSTLAAGDADKYGYGDASPDASKYGYGDAAPDSASDCGSVSSDPGLHRRRQRTARRSSMKQAGAPRRASIGFTGEREIRLPNSEKKVKRRTSISFDENVTVKNVQPVASLTKNPEKLWFQDNEFDKMKEKAFAIIDMVESGELPPERQSKLCVRGLESLLRENQLNKRELRYKAWDSVLDEQDYQMDNGTFEEKAMADAYKLTTMASRVEAQRRAKQDQEEVEKYLRSTRKQIRRMSCQV